MKFSTLVMKWVLLTSNSEMMKYLYAISRIIMIVKSVCIDFSKALNSWFSKTPLDITLALLHLEIAIFHSTFTFPYGLSYSCFYRKTSISCFVCIVSNRDDFFLNDYFVIHVVQYHTILLRHSLTYFVNELVHE